MVEINWTHEAEKWLKDIHDYIALDNSLAAKRVIIIIQVNSRR
jgi:plasmid stabilization system protein ParE